MEAIIGISIVIIIAVLIGISRRRKKAQPLTPDQKQDIVEQVAIIQPIIRDDINRGE